MKLSVVSAPRHCSVPGGIKPLQMSGLPGKATWSVQQTNKESSVLQGEMQKTQPILCRLVGGREPVSSVIIELSSNHRYINFTAIKCSCSRFQQEQWDHSRFWIPVCRTGFPFILECVVNYKQEELYTSTSLPLNSVKCTLNLQRGNKSLSHNKQSWARTVLCVLLCDEDPWGVTNSRSCQQFYTHRIHSKYMVITFLCCGLWSHLGRSGPPGWCGWGYRQSAPLHKLPLQWWTR